MYLSYFRRKMKTNINLLFLTISRSEQPLLLIFLSYIAPNFFCDFLGSERELSPDQFRAESLQGSFPRTDENSDEWPSRVASCKSLRFRRHCRELHKTFFSWFSLHLLYEMRCRNLDSKRIIAMNCIRNAII